MGLFDYTTGESLIKHKKSIQPRKKIARLFKALSVVTVLVVWQAIAGFNLLDLPTPLQTAGVFISLIMHGDPLYDMTLQSIVWASLVIVIKACLLSFLVAVPLGVLMGAVPWVREFTESLFEMLRPVPPLAWIPLAYVVFANTTSPTEYVQIFVVFIGAFFPVLLNTVHGINMVNRIYIEAACTMGASRWQMLSRVMFPGALPSIFNGMRVGFGVGWMCIVAAEFVGGRMGIGYYIWSCYSVGGRTAQIICGIIAIGIIGTAINGLVLFLEKRFIPWH